MTIRKTILTLLLVAASATATIAGPIDDARKLYREGDYDAVIEKLRPVVKRSPRDGNATFFYGASLLATGNVEEALPQLKVAESRGVGEASRMLAETALDNYDVNSAEEHLDKGSANLKKAKKSASEEFETLTSKMIQMRNMLERVERIEIIDSLTVDSIDFFESYRLAGAAGRILPPDAVSRLGAGSDAEELSTAYMPENHSEILWAAADSSGIFRLYGADILDDGTVDHAAPLDDKLGDGGNARYPFLMPDGMTLYFASDGNGSLGGYDIFMTRRTDSDNGGKEFFQPQNLGMPYNSPYNDYMLAIDETSGLGWWASDRNRIPGKVTIYIFAPSPMRINADTSDPSLIALARLSDISLTQKKGVDYKALLESKLPSQTDKSSISSASPRFSIDLGKGKVYYRLSDFRNGDARSAMLDALATEATLRKHLADEEALRSRYRKGDRSVSDAILDSEARTNTLRQRIKEQRNAAVRLENR